MKMPQRQSNNFSYTVPVSNVPCLAIQQLNSSINSNANHLLKKFTQNMFKIMRFMIKLISKLVTHSDHKEKSINYKTQQFCVNCLDSLQQKNIKSLQKELYQYSLPNYDPKQCDFSHFDN